jgi:putative ABC transport system permease protein
MAHIRQTFRAITRRPALAVARLMTVAIVVSAIASVAAIASATLFRQLPFPEPDRLVQIYLLPSDAAGLTNSTPLFPVVFNHLDARGASIKAAAGIWPLDRAVAGSGEPESISAGRVSASFFSVLGASLQLGRTFTADEVTADAAVAVLGYGLWTRMFGSDPAIVGKVIQIDRRSHIVIGITARDFDPAFTSTQLWTPLQVRDAAAVRATVVQTIGRLRHGATTAAATAELQPVLGLARDESPDLLKGFTIGAVDLRESRYGSRRDALLMLVGVVAALGLIATANLANLTLADIASRLGDFALRSALGGSPRTIVLSEVMPCMVLAVIASALGVSAASITAPWMLSLDPSLASVGIAMTIDWRVALVAVSAALTVMAVAVAIPSWQIARRDQLTSTGGVRFTDARGGRLRSWLVGAQTAIALVLLSAAALVVTTLQRNAAVDPGFDPSHVVTGQLRLADNAFPDHPSRVRFIRAVLERLRDTPGIVGAGTTLNLFTVGASFTTNVSVEDAPRPDGQAYSTQFRRVSPGYFEAMRIRVLRGRGFQLTDGETSPSVAVVSDSFARRYWPNGGAVGRRIRRGAATSPWAEIVGVVADVRDAGLNQDTGPVMYTSYYQGSTSATPAGLVVRTAGDPRSAVQLTKQAIWAVDPSQPLSNVVVLEDYLSASLGPQRFRAWLVALCGAFGISLAIIGIYGVTSRSVSERTKEVGIRIALGGHPSHVWWRLVTATLRAVFAGVVAGTVVSLMVDTGIARLLPELGAGNWTFRLGAALVMIGAAAAAAVTAARHAASIEPVRALHGD